MGPNADTTRTTARKAFRIAVSLLVLLLLAVFLCALIGSQHLPPGSTACAIFSFGKAKCGLSPDQDSVLFDIRIPRLILAATVGASLSVAGAAYQALLRNPLAEPYLLGVSNGAAVGTMLAIVFFTTAVWIRPLFAFGGAGFATMFVYRLARGRTGATPERLVLSGVIVTTFLSSAIVFFTTLMDATRIRSFTFWLLGDLSGSTSGMTTIALLVAVGGTVFLAGTSKSLNLLMIGDRDAFDLGVEIGKVRLIVFLAASALVGSSVAAGGSVGYVGLVVPHLVRLLFGSDNRLVVPASAIGGAIFVVVADTIARTVIAPRELPVGAITALVGGPLFIWLLTRQGGRAS